MTFCTCCGQELRPGAAFCDSCGARVAAVAAPQSRRVRRILFATGAGALLALAVGIGVLLVGAADDADGATPVAAVRPTPTPTLPARPAAATAEPQAVVIPAGEVPTTVPETPSPAPGATATPLPAPTLAPDATPTTSPAPDPTATAFTPEQTSTSPTTAPPTATTAAGFQGRLLIWSTLGEPVGFFVAGTTVTADPEPIATFVTSGAFEQQVRSLGVQLDPACDYAFIAFEGSGTYDPVSGWIEGWFLLSLELVSDGTGECGYQYVPARVTFDGTLDASGAGSGSMYNEGLTGAYGWTSERNPG